MYLSLKVAVADTEHGVEEGIRLVGVLLLGKICFWHMRMSGCSFFLLAIILNVDYIRR